MAESIEERVSHLEHNFVQLFGQNFALKLLCISLYLEHPEKQRVLGKWDFFLKTFPELALTEPIPDSMIDYANLNATRFQELLAKLGDAVDQQEGR